MPSLADQRTGEVDHPVSIVGHDFGGIHDLDAVMSRPDLVYSWVPDVIGIFDPDYRWHDLAQTRQTPRAGEDAYRDDGGPTMGECILQLYRDTAQPTMVNLVKDLDRAAAGSGLSIFATDDHGVGATINVTGPLNESAHRPRFSSVPAIGGSPKTPTLLPPS